MAKKLITLMLSACMVLSLVACGSEATTESTNTDNSSNTQNEVVADAEKVLSVQIGKCV